MKIKLRLQYAYHASMTWLLNGIASIASKVLRAAGSASNHHEAQAYSAQIDILKNR